MCTQSFPFKFPVLVTCNPTAANSFPLHILHNQNKKIVRRGFGHPIDPQLKITINFKCKIVPCNLCSEHSVYFRKKFHYYPRHSTAMRETSLSFNYALNNIRECMASSPLLALLPRGVHYENIRKQHAGKYRVIYIHKRENLEFS